MSRDVNYVNLTEQLPLRSTQRSIGGQEIVAWRERPRGSTEMQLQWKRPVMLTVFFDPVSCVKCLRVWWRHLWHYSGACLRVSACLYRDWKPWTPMGWPIHTSSFIFSPGPARSLLTTLSQWPVSGKCLRYWDVLLTDAASIPHCTEAAWERKIIHSKDAGNNFCALLQWRNQKYYLLFDFRSCV